MLKFRVRRGRSEGTIIFLLLPLTESNFLRKETKKTNLSF